jgi:isoleucyl-tRNA synthetase
LEQMELARQVASLGLAARNGAGLKVRQPLGRALAYAGGRRNLDQEFVEIITDELNVKSFEFVEQASQLVRYQVLPDNKSLGPRFGAQFPRLRLALAAADPAVVVANVQAGLPVALEVDGQPVDLKPEEILVQTHPAEGLAVAADKTATVAVDATVTPELRAEGLAREIVRRVQDFRKQSGLDIADRIHLYLAVSAGLAPALAAHRGYIMSETLALELVEGPSPEGMTTTSAAFDGEQLTIGLRKAG